VPRGCAAAPRPGPQRRRLPIKPEHVEARRPSALLTLRRHAPGAGNLGVKSMEAASDQLGIGNPLARPSAAALAAAQAQGQAQATSAAANGAPSAAPQQISGNGGWTLPPAGALAGPGGGLIAPAGGWSAASMGPHPWPRAPAGQGWGGRAGAAAAPGAWAGGGGGGAWGGVGGGGGGYVNAYSPVTSARGAGFYAVPGGVGGSVGGAGGATEAAALAAELGAPSAGVEAPAVNKKAAFAKNNPTVFRIFGRKLRALAAAARGEANAA